MAEWTDEEIVLVSAIEHYSYCPRQCALIHVEKVFDENIFTLRGRHAHERVDEDEPTTVGDVKVERALPLWSRRLGLQGKADTVEFRPDGVVFPVEYKHGPRRAKVHDDLQLCAQALCLEEMLGVSIPAGAIYYCSSHRRREVDFNAELRAKTEDAVILIRRMLNDGDLPPPVNDARCRHCSLADACLPEALVTARGLRVADRLFRPTEEVRT